MLAAPLLWLVLRGVSLAGACYFGAIQSVNIGSDTYVCLVLHSLGWDNNAVLPSSSPTSAASTSPSGMPSGEPTPFPSVSQTEIAPTGQPTASTATRGEYRRVVNVLQADQLSRLSVKNSWITADYSADPTLKALNVTPSLSSGFAVSVESNGVVSYQKAYRAVIASNGSEVGVTYPLLMAIIQVDNGAVKVTYHLTFLNAVSLCVIEHTLGRHLQVVRLIEVFREHVRLLRNES